MPKNTAPTDNTSFLDLAVREKFLSAGGAKLIGEKAVDSQLSPSQLCIAEGLLSLIQAEAIEGLLAPQSIAKGFEIEGLLGYGGIGIVYRARQSVLDRVVALKTISTSRLGDASGAKTLITTARFQQEAKAIAKLKHPNIVTAFEYGAELERVYLAMEYVDGFDLDTYIKDKGKIDELTAWRIAKQVASGLSHALDLGIVHRDIKPANLLLTQPPTGYPLPAGTPLVKVTDFGLAQFNSNAINDDATRITMAGTMLGTPHYMAPEQIEDPNVGFEADIYALGITVYHMVVGEPPWEGMSLMKLLAAKMAGGNLGLDRLSDATGEPSHKLLTKMMARSADDRPHNYQELMAEIDFIIEDESTSPAKTEGAESLTAEFLDWKAPSITSLDLQPTRSLPSRNMLGYLAAIMLVVFTVLYLRNGSAPAEPLYMTSTDVGANVPLFDGRSNGKWKGVSLVPQDPDYAGMLCLLGKSRRSIEEERLSLHTEHYGFSFRVAIPQDDSLEVWFEKDSSGSIHSLLIKNNRLTVGHRKNEQAMFVPEKEIESLIPSRISPNPVIRIDRDSKYWFIRQLVPGEPPPARILGFTRLETDHPPSEMTFYTEAESVYLGDVELVGLQRRPQGDEK